MALVFIVLLVTPSARAGTQEAIVAIDAISEKARIVSQQIFDFEEPGQQEIQSSGLSMEEMRRLGFSVTGDLRVPADLIKDGISKTAFRAELQGKGAGPTITIMLENDAPKNGHACGHNLIATSGQIAAAGLAAVMKETPGRILVIGTPDEERGALDGYDLLIHPDKVRAIAGQIQGIEDQGSQLGAP